MTSELYFNRTVKTDSRERVQPRYYDIIFGAVILGLNSSYDSDKTQCIQRDQAVASGFGSTVHVPLPPQLGTPASDPSSS